MEHSSEADGTDDPYMVNCPSIRLRMRLMQCNMDYMCPVWLPHVSYMYPPCSAYVSCSAEADGTDEHKLVSCSRNLFRMRLTRCILHTCLHVSCMYVIRTCPFFRCYSASQEIRWTTHGTMFAGSTTGRLAFDGARCSMSTPLQSFSQRTGTFGRALWVVCRGDVDLRGQLITDLDLYFPRIFWTRCRWDGRP